MAAFSRAFRVRVGWMLSASVLIALVAWGASRWMSPERRLDAALKRAFEGSVGGRSTIARVDLPIHWAPSRRIERRAQPESASLATLEAAVEIERLASNVNSSSHLNALGLAALAAGALDQGIERLAEAASQAPLNAAIRTNYSAALFQRWTVGGDVQDLAMALNSAEIALWTDPASTAAAYNKALALESLGLRRDAIDQWRTFQGAEPDHQWRREAQSHLDVLLSASEALGRLESRAAQDTSSIRELAQSAPTVVYNQTEDVINRWATNPTVSDRALVFAEALEAADRDRALSGLLRLIHASAQWPSTRRQALIDYVAARSAVIRAIDAASYSDAETALGAAVLAGQRANVPPLEVEVLVQQVRYYVHRDVAAVERLAALEGDLSRAGYWRLLARTHQMRGVQHARAGNFSDAAVQYAHGREVAEVAGDQDVRASLFAVTNELLTQQGQFHDAWEYAQRSLLALPEVRSYRRAHAVLSLAAITAEQAEQPGTGLVLSSALLRLAEEASNPAGVAASQLRRARALALLEQRDATVAAIDAAHRATETIKDPSLRKGYTGDVTWNEGFVLRQVDPARAIRALNVSLSTFEQTGNIARTSEALLARGEANRTLGNTAAAERDWTRGVEVFEDQRLGIREDQLRVSRLSRVWRLFESLVALKADRPAEALDVFERSRARVLLDAIGKSSTPAPLSGPAIYRWLPAGVTGLAFSVHPDRLLIFVVTRDGVTLHSRAVTQPELAKAVSSFRASIRTGNESSEAARLGDLLIPADVSLARDAPLLIVPDGPLHQLPFAALRVGPQRQVLIEATQPVIAPSFSVAERLAHEPWRPSTRAVIIAPYGATSKLPVLPGARAEAQALAQLYPTMRQLIGTGITSAAVLHALADSDLVHFAGHAIVDDRYPSQSRLVVEGGDNLRGPGPSDIADAHLRKGAVAILAACNTARGSVMAGEGALTLARAFLMGGASSVVGTLWAIDDKASSEFLLEFHRALVTGVPPATALAKVQREAIRRSQSADWAAFIVITSVHKGV